jgi:hypothetical protein
MAEAGGLDDVEAVAVAAQQHGCACLDDRGEVMRPALCGTTRPVTPEPCDLEFLRRLDPVELLARPRGHDQTVPTRTSELIARRSSMSILDSLAEQRYAEFEGGAPVLTERGAPIGFDETTDPIGREFGEFYSTPLGHHHNSITSSR